MPHLSVWNVGPHAGQHVRLLIDAIRAVLIEAKEFAFDPGDVVVDVVTVQQERYFAIPGAMRIYVESLYAKPERTPELLRSLAGRIIAAVRERFPNQAVIVTYRPLLDDSSVVVKSKA